MAQFQTLLHQGIGHEIDDLPGLFLWIFIGFAQGTDLAGGTLPAKGARKQTLIRENVPGFQVKVSHENRWWSDRNGFGTNLPGGEEPDYTNQNKSCMAHLKPPCCISQLYPIRVTMNHAFCVLPRRVSDTIHAVMSSETC